MEEGQTGAVDSDVDDGLIASFDATQVSKGYDYDQGAVYRRSLLSQLAGPAPDGPQFSSSRAPTMRARSPITLSSRTEDWDLSRS